MYIDAFALVGTAALTAVVGLAFWAVAARVMPPERLGVDTALVSLVTAAASACAVGTGNAFTAILPVAGSRAVARLRQGYRLVLITSLVVGTLAGGAAWTLLRPGVHGVLTAAVVTCSVVVWSLFVVQDLALTGMGRATWLPWENVGVSLAKLALLPLLVGVSAHPVLLATVLPSAVAVGVVSGMVVPWTAGRRSALVPPASTREPDRGVQAMREFAVRDSVANALSLGVLLLLPFLVTAMAGPAEGAVFGICLAIAQGLDLVSAGTGVSLTVHAADRPSEALRMTVAIWRRVALLVAVGAVALSMLARFALPLLGDAYVERGGVTVIIVLAVTSVIRTVFILWTSLQRALQRTAVLLRVNIGFACTVLPLVVLLAHRWGAVGAAVGLAVAQCVFTGGILIRLLLTREVR
jgi:O-antigen/teichoic acid export membrane protein